MDNQKLQAVAVLAVNNTHLNIYIKNGKHIDAYGLDLMTT